MTAHRVRYVASFAELVATPFAGDVNALCWPRRLAGDFDEIVGALAAGAGITSIDDDDLAALALSPAGAAARDVLLADLALMRGHGLEPSLDCVNGYLTDGGSGPVATDVTSFHADRAPVAADTYLCTYCGATSEGLANESAVRRVDMPDVRARLLDLYGGSDDAGFAAWLAEHSYDLHYAPSPGAEPYTFGLGNLWRIAIAHPGSPVPPCIHRAPPTPPGAPSRLLLIS